MEYNDKLLELELTILRNETLMGILTKKYLGNPIKVAKDVHAMADIILKLNNV
jgi:hypothetical protein